LIVALYFVLTNDDPYRFRSSREVAAFFGLRPVIRESGSVSHYGRITKEGDPEMRRLLVQAAHALLRTTADSELKRWALALAERRGKSKAVVALARKLAVLMHHLWVTGVVYEPFPHEDTAQAA
jgi:transposase